MVMQYMVRQRMLKSRASIIVGTLLYIFSIIGLIWLGLTMLTTINDLTWMLVGLVPIVIAVILGFSFYKFLKGVVDERKIGKEHKGTFTFRQAIFLVIFIFSFMPFILPLVDHGLNVKDQSIYNQTWSGCSDLKSNLVSQGYNVESIQSSLSAALVNSTSPTGAANPQYKILCIMGPNRAYIPLEDMGFFVDFINSGGSLLICDDHGSTSTLLFEMAMYTKLATPLLEFSNGIVADNVSYGINPYYPVIEPQSGNFNFGVSLPGLSVDLNNPTLFSGVNKVICDHASAIIPTGALLSGGMGGSGQGGSGSASNLTVFGSTTPFLSYLDMNGDFMFNNATDQWDPSLFTKLILQFGGMFSQYVTGGQAVNTTALQQQVSYLIQSYPKIIFAGQNLTKGRLFLSGDASVFANQLMEDSGYDNARFAQNVFTWLSNNGTQSFNPSQVTIYFDEAHIGPETLQEFSTAYIYGLIIGYVNWFCSSSIFAWIAPFIAISMLYPWLPKQPKQTKQKKSPKEKEGALKIQFQSETAFVRKIKQLRSGKDYNEPLIMLYRRILRRLHRLLEDKEPTPSIIISLIKNASKKDISPKDEVRIHTFFDTMNRINSKTARMQVKTEEDFKKWFFEMTWIADFLNLNLTT